MTVTTRNLLRAGSFLAGLISVGWGLYEIASGPSGVLSGSTNVYFVLSSMIEAIVLGLFALTLAILSR